MDNDFIKYTLISPTFGLHDILYVGKPHHGCRGETFRECLLPDGVFFGYMSMSEINKRYKK